MSNPVSTVSVFVPAIAEEVWEIITNPHLFHGLGFPGVYSKFDTREPKEGSVTLYRSIFGGSEYPRYVSVYEPLAKFSIGTSPTDQTFTWTLKADGIGTNVTFTRVFRKAGFFERILDRKNHSQASYDELARVSIDALREAGNNLSQGRPHGIFSSD